MTIKSVQSGLQRFAGVCRSLVSERFSAALKNRKRKPDEGGLLVEVLVGMFIMVLVFTAVSIALSSMGDQRVRIEQRDRALKLASQYDELTRVFKCGFIVDKIQDSLAQTATGPGAGQADFISNTGACDWDGSPGDQSWEVVEEINENNTRQEFTVDIRYWWEWPGKNNIHMEDCGTIAAMPEKELPLILVRGIRVTWNEKGAERQVGIVKRDPVPNNSVVFASGNRVTILVDPALNAGGNFTFNPYPALGSAGGIKRLVSDPIFDDQPRRCVAFPYITPDGSTRNIPEAGPGAVPASIDGVSFPPQHFVVVD